MPIAARGFVTRALLAFLAISAGVSGLGAQTHVAMTPVLLKG